MANLGLGRVLIFCLFLPVFAGAAEPVTIEKPFIKMPIDKAVEIEGNIEAQKKALRENFRSHISYVVENVFPRVEAEIDYFLRPHVYEGKTFYIAEAVSYADLFHFHIRMPFQQEASLANFANPGIYHLQYHSLERIQLLKIQWLKELQKIDGAVLQAWVSAHLEKINKSQDSSFIGSEIHNGPAAAPIAVLAMPYLEEVAARWSASLGEKSPGAAQLLLHLRILNDFMDNDAYQELMDWRSIASYQDRYEVLFGIDTKNAWQPLDVYYESITESPEVAEVLRAFFKETGKAWVENPDGEDSEWLPAMDEELKAKSRAVFDKIEELAIAHPDPNNTLKNSAIDTGRHFITAFALGDKYIYAFRYNID